MLALRGFFLYIGMLGIAEAKTQLSTCPESLSIAHIKILKDEKMIALADVIFNLDGGSEQKIHEHDLSHDAPFAYARTESHKIACWYKSQNSYICLREK